MKWVLCGIGVLLVAFFTLRWYEQQEPQPPPQQDIAPASQVPADRAGEAELLTRALARQTCVRDAKTSLIDGTYAWASNTAHQKNVTIDLQQKNLINYFICRSIAAGNTRPCDLIKHTQNHKLCIQRADMLLFRISAVMGGKLDYDICRRTFGPMLKKNREKEACDFLYKRLKSDDPCNMKMQKVNFEMLCNTPALYTFPSACKRGFKTRKCSKDEQVISRFVKSGKKDNWHFQAYQQSPATCDKLAEKAAEEICAP